MTVNLALILGVALTFVVSCFTSAYESKPGVPKSDQY